MKAITGYTGFRTTRAGACAGLGFSQNPAKSITWGGTEYQTLEGRVILALAATFSKNIIAGTKIIIEIRSNLHGFPLIGYVQVVARFQNLGGCMGGNCIQGRIKQSPLVSYFKILVREIGQTSIR